MESLVIHDSKFNNVDCIFNGIEKGLYLSKEQVGHLRIFIQFGEASLTTPKSSDIFIKISRILIQLYATNLDDFILIVEMIGTVDDEWEEHKKLFGQKNILKFNIRTVDGCWRLEITNKDCKINGLHQNAAFTLKHIDLN